VSPEGDVWVQRTAAESDTVSRYDIFAVGGGIVKHAVFPARTRVVGFGRGAIYAVRIDDDDLQHLQRFKR
jgi:hypothetical protein